MFLVESVERQLGIRIDAKDKVYVKQFARRAEIFDTEHGNIVILNKVGQVCEAMHGTKKQLSGQEIEQIYGKDRQYVNWESARKCERNPHHETFLSDFLSPCYLVLALIVDYCPEKEYYKRGLQAVMTALDDHFGPANFAAKTGSFFPAMQANPRKFLHKLTQEELSFLTTMRSRGKKIFLMTNSKRDFAELVMQTVIGNDWTEHFDFILTSSQKPHFFTRPDGFESAQGKSYTKGSLRALREVHPEINSRVLYFGDGKSVTRASGELVCCSQTLTSPTVDIRTDILPTSTLVQWDNGWWTSSAYIGYLPHGSIVAF